jgi:hypothetical protein
MYAPSLNGLRQTKLKNKICRTDVCLVVDATFTKSAVLYLSVSIPNMKTLDEFSVERQH